MEYKLSFRTKPVYVSIDNYEKYSFNYQGWTISDNYVLNESSSHHSQYSIAITSPNLANKDELNNYSLQGQKIADIITELIPISGLPSLNSPKFKSFFSNLALVDYKSAPNGWRSNYATILPSLNRESGNKCNLNVSIEGFVYPTALEQSPLHEIQQMLEHYDDAEDPIKFLLFLNNSILSANDINVFMLIGKSIEIINALYPYKKHQGSNDRRIEKYFPELIDVFQDITIEKIFSWSNNRKETRHYPNKKNNKIPHESLSDEEKIKMYKCSTYLIINVIRHSFELPHISFCFKLKIV